MILETNADVMTSIRKFYERLLDNTSFDHRTSCRERVQYFALQVENMIYDSRAQIARAKILVQITEARKTLVSLQTSSTLSFETEITAAPSTSTKSNNGEDGNFDH
jgi:hypothetical protein